MSSGARIWTQVGNQSRADRLEFSRDSGGTPRPALADALAALTSSPEGSQDGPLGEPMSVQEAARLIGCSVWTLRYRLLRQGLPHFRLSGSKKLVFYRKQVVAWILEKQREGR